MPTMTMSGPATAGETRARLNHLAWLLDNSIRLPGTDFRIGLEVLLGFVPVLGDALGVLLSGYIVHQAARLGVPPGILFRMVMNVAIEGLIGSVPIAGDVFDAAWKANQRNVVLLNEWLDVPGPRPTAGPTPVLLVLVALLGVIALTVVLVVLAACWIWAAFSPS